MIERVDDLGELMQLPGPAHRIVCLVPSITETLFAFGAGPGVVGITDYCVLPLQEVQAKTKIGGTKNLAVEKILSLGPDLVIANAEENRKHQIETLRAAGVKVFVTFPKTVDACLKMMRDVAALTGTEAAAAPVLHSVEQARNDVRSSTLASLPAVFCPIWKNPYMSINHDTFVGCIIREAGARNIFADSADRYPQITLAEVARRKPDIIILPTEPYHFVEFEKTEFEVIGQEVPAIRNRRIHIVEGELLSWYGPRVSRALITLSELFCAEPLRSEERKE